MLDIETVSSVKVAVVGVGALGQHHARIYSELRGCELVALVDVKPERATQLADHYGCRPLVSHRDLFGQVEAVSLAVPTLQHAEVGEELLRQGIHVLVEKPLAHDLEAAETLIGARRESGCVLHVGHSERFNPALVAVRDFVTRPLFFEAHRLGVFVARSLDVDVVLDLMIHDLDLVLHLVKAPIRELRAVGIPVLTPKVDLANARLEFENGCVANLTASRVSVEKTRKFRFFQPHDYVSINLQSQDAQMFSLMESKGEKRIEQRKLEIHHEEPLKLEIEAFLAAVRGTKTEYPVEGCTAEEGKQALSVALQLLDEIRKSRAGPTPGGLSRAGIN